MWVDEERGVVEVEGQVEVAGGPLQGDWSERMWEWTLSYTWMCLVQLLAHH